MLWAGGAALLGAGFALMPAPPVPAGAVVETDPPEAACSWFRFHSSAVSPPATARITRMPARSSHRCRRRSALGSGPPAGPNGRGGGVKGGGGSASTVLGEPSAESSPTASGGAPSAAYGGGVAAAAS